GIHRQLAVLLSPALNYGARALPLGRQSHRFVFNQLRYGETVVCLDKRQVAQPKPRLRKRSLPGTRATLELQNVALRHRQKVLHVFGGTKRNGFFQPERGLDIGKDYRSGAVRYQRTIGPLERTGNERI